MYLTRMRLDITRPQTMKALASPNLLHAAVESAFPGARKRRLWRIDQLNGTYYLLLLSQDAPDLTGVARQFGSAATAPQWETKAYAPLLARIAAGTSWQFRLVANPTQSCSPKSGGKGAGKQRGAVYAHVTIAQQKEWLMQRAQRHGFALKPDGFSVQHSQWLRFYKNKTGHFVTLRAVAFEGSLQVTDAALFCETLCQGIGRGKAYGMGMLTVVRHAEGYHG